MKIFTPTETKIIPVTTDVLTTSVIEIEEDLEPKPIQGEQFWIEKLRLTLRTNCSTFLKA